MSRLRTRLISLALSTCTLAGVAAAPARAAGPRGPGLCPPAGAALGYSDALDKVTGGDATVGGLSDLAWDRYSRAWVSTVDNHGDDPARLWSFRDLAHPRLTQAPLVLTDPSGTPYTGQSADNEGLAVLPGGDYLVSSETEPSVRIFDRHGRQRASLPVPARFAVRGTTPAGEAAANATFEGLAVSPDGRTAVAAMEGALAGDVVGDDDTAHRFLVYRRDGRGTWQLTRQVGYRTQPGQRIPEVAFTGRDDLLVMEAAYAPGTGNVVQLYAVRGLDRAPDVSRVGHLGAAPTKTVAKRLVTDVTACPSLGAKAKGPQTNPLMDNYEGMAVTGDGPLGLRRVTLVSDDNFNPTQTTRLLDLVVHLPR